MGKDMYEASIVFAPLAGQDGTRRSYTKSNNIGQFYWEGERCTLQIYTQG